MGWVMDGLTFAQMDKLAAARKAKRAECVERLEQILLDEFDAAELMFVWTVDGPDLSLVKQAIQNARAKAR
jgi:hypothetical protein